MDLESLRPWNTHWADGAVTARVLKHPVPRAAVPKWIEELLAPIEDQWLLRPGPRQVGKTTSLGHVAATLVETDGVEARQVVIAPLDDPSIREASEGRLEAIMDAASKQHAPTAARPLYLLLDEIQEFPDWAKQFKAAWDKHHATVRVLATGSSALQILRPVDADFHGRIRSITVHPMKFREVLEAHPDAAERLPDEIRTPLRQHVRSCRQALAQGHEGTADAFEDLHGFLHAHELQDWIHQVWLEYLAWGGYPVTRPGSSIGPVDRLDRFGSAMDTVLARDVSQGGVRKLREFRLLFRGISRNPGGKFQPYTYASDLSVAGEVIREWKQILEGAMLVQQLPPLKPNLTPAKGNDKAYPTDPGWVSFAHGNTDTVPDQEVLGHVAESVLVDHVRRLQFNIAGNTRLPMGYIAKPEVDLAADLGPHWVLIEAKYRAQPTANFGDVGGDDDVRIVATRDTYQLNPAPGAHYLPAHELALVC